MQAKNFKQAAQMALDERWYPISKARSIKKMCSILYEGKCELCKLQTRKGHIADCGECPMSDGSGRGRCCEEYMAWSQAKTLRIARREALVVVARLEKIAGIV